MSNPFYHFSVLVLCLFITACDKQENSLLELNGLTMGTSYSIKINHLDDSINRSELNQYIQTLLQQVNASMSTYDDDSELSQFNHSTNTDWTTISTELSYVIEQAVYINQQTDGAFDITIGPIINLWGFGPDGNIDHTPEMEQVTNLLNKINITKLHLQSEPAAIKKDDPALYLDLSAIAKGYAVDRIARYLQEIGIHNYLVEIGGEIRSKGVNISNEYWRVGIEKPLSEERSVQQIIYLQEMAMATSGDYRNYFEESDIHYSHIIDPRSGYPITHTLAAVSVLHESTMFADAFATALMVLGPEQGIEIAQRNGLDAVFIIKTKQGFTEKYTGNFANYLIH